MSRSLNKVMLIGNLGADPEIRTTANGSKVANFNIATSRQWSTPGGEKQEKTEWHRCVAWNTKFSTLADVVERYCKKGDRVYVEGRIDYGQYKDKEGQTKYTTEINVRELMMLGGGTGGGRGNDFDSDSEPSRSRAPARSGSRGNETFDDFPAALEDQDDDLPF